MPLPRALPLTEGTGLQVVDFLTYEATSDVADADGTVLLELPSPDPGFLWRVERIVSQCASDEDHVPIWSLFATDRRPETLRDFVVYTYTISRDYPAALTVESGAPLICQWSGAYPAFSFATMHVQYQLVQRVN